MAIRHMFRWKDKTKTQTLTALKALRLRCLDCCCWNSVEVARYPAELCPAWPFRLGRSSVKPGE